MARCAHCLETVATLKGLVLTHDWPKPCRQVCPGALKLPVQYTSEVAERVMGFSASIVAEPLTPTRCGDLLLTATVIFRVLEATEAKHVAEAIAMDGWPFEAAQAELQAVFSALSRACRAVTAATKGALAQRLIDLAVLADKPTMTSLKELASIRAARDAMRKR